MDLPSFVTTTKGNVPGLTRKSSSLDPIRRTARMAAKIETMRRQDIPEYPVLALREVLVNAVAHADYSQVALEQRLRDALAALSPALPTEALDDASRRHTRPERSSVEARNRAVHGMLVDGVTVESRNAEGRIAGAHAMVLDFNDASNNDWLAANQFTVADNRHTRRLDVVVFEDDGGKLAKKLAGYHQFHSVNVAVGETLRAIWTQKGPWTVADDGRGYETRLGKAGKPGDRRVGVVWHTQSSGKRLTMAFYAGLIIRQPAMEKSTLVVLTDRNDVDDELVGTLRNSVTLDWTEREAVRAKIRVAVKRLLRKYGYPPDKQEQATQPVLEQAELLCADWVG